MIVQLALVVGVAGHSGQGSKRLWSAIVLREEGLLGGDLESHLLLLALDRVGLAGKALAAPQTLSGGEQQRASIARAIVHRPRIILADEPTANLDRDSGRQVLDMLQAFNDAGVTCIISTHDERLLERASRVVELAHGRVATIREAGSEVGA